MQSIIIIVYIVSIICCHYIAKKRGVKPVFWGAMGLIIGPLAIPFIFLSKEKNEKST